MKAILAAVASLAAAGACAADFEVYKCTSPRGDVSYQPLPCPLDFAQKKMEILPFSAGFDPTDAGTLFKREAQMDKRRAEAAKAEEAGKAQEAAAGPSDATFQKVGGAAGPALPTEASNDAKHQSRVANGPTSRR